MSEPVKIGDSITVKVNGVEHNIVVGSIDTVPVAKSGTFESYWDIHGRNGVRLTVPYISPEEDD